MSNRITNSSATPMSKEEAMTLLRSKCIADGDGLMPGMQMLGAIMAAYPEARLPSIDPEEPPAIDWQTIAWQLAIDFVPAFQAGGAPGRPGRPVIPKHDIVAIIKNLIQSGEAKSIKQACNLVQASGLFPGLRAVDKAYYRAKKLQESNTAPTELSQ